MDFNLVRLHIKLQLIDDVTDPYILFGLRGLFPRCLRSALACERGSCEQCEESGACAGFSLLSQSLSTDPSAVKRFQKPSLPFIFDLPVLPPPPNRGQIYPLAITLVGSAVHLRETYLAALRMALASFPVGALQVESVGYEGESLSSGKDASPPGELILLSAAEVSSQHLPGSGVTVKITTPMTLLREGRPLRDLSPDAFLRALLRRVSSQAFYYGSTEFDVDFKWLAAEAASIRWESNDFRWTQWPGFPGGVTGNGILAGNVSEFHPFILLGEYLHLGKGCTYGMGRFEIERA